MFRKLLRPLLVLGLFGIFAFIVSTYTPIAYAAAYVVTKTADTADGTCDADCSLREAITDANTNTPVPDTITFLIPGSDPNCSAANVCTITLGSTATSIGDDLTIDGSPNSADITIDGASTYRVLLVNSSVTLNVNMLTIANGRSTGGGAGGGGIRNNGILNVTAVTFAGNTTTGSGGGIYNDGTATVTDSTFHNGSGFDGGGIYNSDTRTLTVTGSTFYGNSASAGGGGIGSNGAVVNVTNSTFFNNTARLAGGGIHSGSGTTTVTNSTVYDNRWGGVSYGGGGISSLSSGTTTILRNTIVANSFGGGGDCFAGLSGVVSADAFNIDGDGSCDSATQMTNAQINLAALGNYGGPTQTMALLSGSLAIDAADDAVCNGAPVSNLDQRGVTRPNTDCDVGAFEAQATGTIIIEKTTNPSGGTNFDFNPPQIVSVNSPGAIAGDYDGGGAFFGPPLDATGITGNLELVSDGVGTVTDGCEPLVGFTAGNIALIDRGTCLFSVKVQNAQNAGAIAVIIVNTLGDGLFTMEGMGGATIPTVVIGNTNGNAIKAQLPAPGVNATLHAPLGGVFDLDDGQTHQINDVIPAQYEIWEGIETGDGFDVTAITCDDYDSSGNLANATATINVEPDETVTCTFTNDSTNSIVIEKVTDPAGLTGAFFGTPHYVTQYTPVNSQASFAASGATFGPALSAAAFFGNLQLVNDGSGVTTDACQALVGFTPGNIALIDRGNCNFDVKVQNAQTAGAIAAVIYNNIDDELVIMDGAGPTIPSVFIGLTSGNALKASLALPATVTVDLTAPLGGVFGLDDGQSRTFNFVPVGQYPIIEDETGGVDITLSNLTCNDKNSTVDIPNRTATINLEDEEIVTCTFTNRQSATAVNVTGVQAIVNKKGNIVVKWRTTSESQIAGFNVYRKSGKAQWKQVNANFIQAKNAGGAQGNKYRVADRNVKTGKTYRYKIEVIYLDNHSEWTQVVKVKTPK